MGDRFNVRALPEPLRDGLIQKRPVEVDRPQASRLREDLGLKSGARPFFTVPLFVRDELRGVLGVTSGSVLSRETREGLAALGSQVSLALQSLALAEDLHRRQSEERFRSMVQNASDVILVMGADQTVSYISPAVESVLGYKPEDVIGKDNIAPVHPDDMPGVQETLACAVGNPGVPFPLELRLQHADGSWRHLASTCTSLLDDPAVNGIVINSRDVTERKRAEQALQESEERFRSLVEQATDALFVHDLEGRLVDVNQQACDSLGYTREELLTMSVNDVEKNFDLASLSILWERISSDGPINLNGIHRRKDGTTFPVEVRIGPLATGGRRLVLAAARYYGAKAGRGGTSGGGGQIPHVGRADTGGHLRPRDRPQQRHGVYEPANREHTRLLCPRVRGG
jgi:PAS domain S-box-containing protein